MHDVKLVTSCYLRTNKHLEKQRSTGTVITVKATCQECVANVQFVNNEDYLFS